jgi:pilus assembly protein CpaF
MEGDVITVQDVFNFKQTGENRDGSLAGKFEAAGFRPHCVDRAAAFGLERQLLESVAAVVQG